MTHTVFYRLADISIRVDFDFVYLAEHGYMHQFLSPASDKPDFTLQFRQTTSIADFQEKAPKMIGQYLKYHYYEGLDGNVYCFHLHGGYYHAVTIISGSSGVCWYISQSWLHDELTHGNHLENFFCLEKIFLKFGCMVLHSCHVQADGEAILFSAPSQTGKSTQGELWRDYAGAAVVNGDRTAIRKTDGVWTAYGVPFCGSSGIHLNREAPIRAVVVIRQAPENRVRSLSGREAFSLLYSELTVNSWDRQFAARAVDWALTLTREVPVCYFQCNKKPDAVYTLREFLENWERNHPPYE